MNYLSANHFKIFLVDSTIRIVMLILYIGLYVNGDKNNAILVLLFTVTVSFCSSIINAYIVENKNIAEYLKDAHIELKDIHIEALEDMLLLKGKR